MVERMTTKRVLMGPGPSDVPAEVLEALARPTIGHLDPEFLQVLDEMGATIEATVTGDIGGDPVGGMDFVDVLELFERDDETDAVIMIEHIQMVGDDRIRIEAPAFPWQHVRKMGEDIVATELLYPRGHMVTPYCVGALISGGVYQVPVRKKPRVLIIPTGSELVDWRSTAPQDLKPG